MSDDRFFDIHGDISDAEAERQSIEEMIAGYMQEFLKDIKSKMWEQEHMLESRFKDLPNRVLFRECIAEIVDSITDQEGEENNG